MAALSSVLVTTNKNKCRIIGSVVFTFKWMKSKKTQAAAASLCCLPQSLLELPLCAKSQRFWTGTAWRNEGVRVEGVLWDNLAPILLVVTEKSAHRPGGRVVLGGGFCSGAAEFFFL